MNELSSRGCGPEETPPRCTLIVDVEPGHKPALHSPGERSASSLKDTVDVCIVMCIMRWILHAFRHEHCLRCPCNLAVYFHVLQCSCLTLQCRRYDVASRQAKSHFTQLPYQLCSRHARRLRKPWVAKHAAAHLLLTWTEGKKDFAWPVSRKITADQ